MKNTRAKTVDREHAYEVRGIGGSAFWALKYYQADDDKPGARVLVAVRSPYEYTEIGRDMYVSFFKKMPLIDNPLQAALTKDTIFPSARELLNAGVSCREPGGRGWAVYWMEGGVELTLFPGGEGPQEMSSVDELIDALGGDQECVLTPASIKRFGTLEALQAHLEAGKKPVYTQLEFSDFIHVDCCQQLCEMCDSWVATQTVNGYAVCDKPKCQDKAEAAHDN